MERQCWHGGAGQPSRAGDPGQVELLEARAEVDLQSKQAEAALHLAAWH